MNPAIDVIDLDVSYRSAESEVEAIKGLSLTVARGEFVAAVGSSGCGKTTLLNAICGLLPVKSGTILIHGLQPVTAREKGMFGVVFQEPALFPWRTALENVLLPYETRWRQGVDGDDRKHHMDRALDMIETVGLLGYEDAYPDQLSGGMKTRIAIARALVYSPEILLLDEPFGNLDEMTRADLNQELLQIARKVGCTVLLVTHSLSEALLLSDRVLVMGPRPTTIMQSVSVHLTDRSPSATESEDFIVQLRDLRRALENKYWQ